MERFGLSAEIRKVLEAERIERKCKLAYNHTKTHCSQCHSSGKPDGWPQLYHISAGRNQDGRLEIFGVATNGTLWQIWQMTPNGSWSHWETRGAPVAERIDLVSPTFARALVVGSNQDGRLDGCVIASRKVWCIGQTNPNNGWGSWRSLDSPPSFGDVVSIDRVRKNDGRLQLLALSKRGSLATRCQAAPNGNWADWHNLGAPTDNEEGFLSIAIGQNQDGRLEAFVVHNGELWHTWETQLSELSDQSILTASKSQQGVHNVT